jgi:hypothetical protein
MTIKNLAVNVQENGSGTSTFGSSHNGANRNLTISISANTIGMFQDTTHSDSVVAGDDFDYTYDAD